MEYRNTQCCDKVYHICKIWVKYADVSKKLKVILVYFSSTDLLSQFTSFGCHCKVQSVSFSCNNLIEIIKNETYDRSHKAEAETTSGETTPLTLLRLPDAGTKKECDYRKVAGHKAPQGYS